MFWTRFNSATANAVDRDGHNILLYVRRNQPAPVMPIELSGRVSPDTWASRMVALNKLCMQYYKPAFEATWMILTFILSILVPAITLRLVFRSLDDPDSIFFDEQDEKALVDARFAAFGTFVGVILLFYVPLFMWKRIGQQRANAMVRRWGNDDARVRGGPGAFVPSWKVRMPSVFASQMTLSISLPANQLPTNFHPAAYLPSWISGPLDEKAPAYQYQSNVAVPTLPYSGAGQGQGQDPFMDPGAMDAIPLYNERDEKAGAAYYHRAADKV